MDNVVNLWPLLGIAAIVLGFVLRFNPVLVVIVAGFVTGLAAHMPLADILEKLGAGFLNTRNLPLILLLPLAVIGLLERHGLKERAQTWIAQIKTATAGRLLIVYLFVREITAALGLTSLGGHPQMVRPLLAPMAEGATENRYGEVPPAVRHRLRAIALWGIPTALCAFLIHAARLVRLDRQLSRELGALNQQALRARGEK